MKRSIATEWPQGIALRRWASFLVLAVGVQFVGMLPSQAADPKPEFTDQGITSAVEGGLALEKGVLPNDVDVSTSQGIVSLSGSVDGLLAKVRAVKIAESIRGVRGVVDRLVVAPVVRPDEDIRKDIETTLRQNPATESYAVEVSVQDAVATLKGNVGSKGEEQLATRMAERVKGVKEVRNQLAINYLQKHTDAEMTADAKARLGWDVMLNGALIRVAIKGGQATLTGTVGSLLGKMRAIDDTWVNGVTYVDGSELQIDPYARADAHRQSEYDFQSDAQIQQAVQAALRLDPRLKSSASSVTGANGVATLHGTVRNLKAKSAAQEDATNIQGVWSVDNFLKVRPETWPRDAEMQTQLRTALSWDPLLDSSTIDAAVIRRVAYLSGAVATDFQKAEAQDIASLIKGVVLIRNHLKVEPEFSVGFYEWPYFSQGPLYATETFGPPPVLSDRQIKKNIEHAFFWSPFVHSEEIKVTVDGGVATLTGKVGSWLAYGEADKDARQSGATAVRDQLQVK